jgi:NADH-quinone oxidoreductase subunit G
LLNRGENAEITTYLEEALDSELSGNVVDLCPVGALTSKPYAFAARPWELKKTETIDVMDAMGSNIRVDARGGQVLRVLPRLHEDINEEWISDKTRHACDGLSRQRLDRPYVRQDGKLQPATWEQALGVVAAKMSSTETAKIAAITGDQVDSEAMFALKQLMDAKGVTSVDCRQDGAKVGAGARAGYLFNSGFAAVEEADALLLIGTNPRWEAPVWNARVRKRWLSPGAFPIALVGEAAPLTYDHEHLGTDADTLRAIADGSHPFATVLSAAERPMLVIGMGALSRDDGASMLGLARQIAENYGLLLEGWNGFNVLHTAASRVAGLDLGLLPGDGGRDVAGILDGAKSGDIEMVYLLGADEIASDQFGDAFVVYQGHHGDQGAHRADVILPGAAYTEKDGLYINAEGRVQMALRAVFPPGDAREDWKILRALAGLLQIPLAFDDLAGLRAALVAKHPHFELIDIQEPGEWGAFGEISATQSTPFETPINNFYMTDPISRASETMAQCSQAFVEDRTARTGTDG